MIRADDVRPAEPLRYGAYVCLPPVVGRHADAGPAVEEIAQELGLRNEYDSEGADPPASIAYLRGQQVTRGDIGDDRLESARAIVHVAGGSLAPVSAFCERLRALLSLDAPPRIIGGVVRPTSFTGNLMHNFAYAHRVLQQPATVAPNAFLLPMNKSAAWWKKDWMEQHTYLLPRYDESGRMTADGHALAAAVGTPYLLRRTYRHHDHPAPSGTYDFVNYFECADEHIPMFRESCERLRDRARNPEWEYVQEGPTWHGRRVATWAEMVA